MICLENGQTEKNRIIFNQHLHLSTFIAMPSDSQIPTSYGCSLCDRDFTSSGGLARHTKAIHPTLSNSLPEDSTKYVCIRHSYLTGDNHLSFDLSKKLTSDFVSS